MQLSHRPVVNPKDVDIKVEGQPAFFEGPMVSSKQKRAISTGELPSAYRYLHDFSYADLELPEEKRKAIGRMLASSFRSGDPPEKIAPRLLKETGGKFSCAPLSNFMKSNHGSRFVKNYSVDSVADVCFLYIHTRFFEAENYEELNRLKVVASGISPAIGIMIVNVPGECTQCNAVKLTYTWSEVEAIPTLPRHWGCRCVYELWIA